MGDMEDRLILDNMDDLGRPQGSYPEGFVSLLYGWLTEKVNGNVLTDVRTYVRTYVHN